MSLTSSGLIILPSIIHKGFSPPQAYMEFLRSGRHRTEMMETVLRHDLLSLWVLFLFWRGFHISFSVPEAELCWAGHELFCLWRKILVCAPRVQCSQSFPGSLKKSCFRDFQTVLAIKRFAGLCAGAENASLRSRVKQRVSLALREAVSVFLLLVH